MGTNSWVKSLDEIKDVLASLGLSFGMTKLPASRAAEMRGLPVAAATVYRRNARHRYH